MEVDISPFETGGPFGGFQSRRGTGYQVPITITFSKPVSAVAAIIIDPDFLHNFIRAYDADSALVDGWRFDGDGTPGKLTRDTITVSGAGIVRVVLTPDPRDYVAYEGLSFVKEGEGDAILVEMALSRTEVVPVLATRLNARTQGAFICATWISGQGCQRWRGAIRDDIVTVTVSATHANTGNPVIDRSVHLVGTPVDGSGEHPHNPGDRPTGSWFSDPDANMSDSLNLERGEIEIPLSEDGTATLTYRTSGVSGLETLQAIIESADGPVEDEATVTIRLGGFVAMPRDGEHYYFKDQSSTIHGDINHWIVESVRQKITDVFSAYFRVVPEPRFAPGVTRFVITESSLQWGGIFDLTPWTNPHLTHRRGINLDIRRTSLNSGGGIENEMARERTFQAICRINGIDCWAEDSLHYHTRPLR